MDLQPALTPVMQNAHDSCTHHSNEARERQLMARLEAEGAEEHSHSHSHDDKHAQNTKKVAFMILITFGFFLVELTVGFVNRSIALLADSYHMLSDVMALTIALICLKLSRRKSKKNGFGWVRAEVLGALVNGTFLLAMCFTISMEAIGRLMHPMPMKNPEQVLIVGVIGLLINLVGIGLFHGGHGHSHGGGGGHGHSHSHKHKKGDHSPAKCTEEAAEQGDSLHEGDNLLGRRAVRSLSILSNEVSHGLSMIVGSGSKQHLALRLVNLDETVLDEEYDDQDDDEHEKKIKQAENLNMRGVFLHILSDAIGSVFVIITASLAWFLPNLLGKALLYMDPILSLCLVSLISFSAYGLVKETAAIILRKPPMFVNFDRLKKDLKKIRGIAKVDDIKVWTLVANRHIATAQIEFCSPAIYSLSVPKIRKLFHRAGLHSLTLFPIFNNTMCTIPEETTDLTSSPSTSLSSQKAEKQH